MRYLPDRCNIRVLVIIIKPRLCIREEGRRRGWGEAGRGVGGAREEKGMRIKSAKTFKMLRTEKEVAQSCLFFLPWKFVMHVVWEGMWWRGRWGKVEEREGGEGKASGGKGKEGGVRLSKGRGDNSREGKGRWRKAKEMRKGRRGEGKTIEGKGKEAEGR